MRQVLFVFLLGVICLTLQTTLLASFFIQWVRPDLLLILTLFLGFSFPPISGGIVAFLLGYLMDLFSGNGFGLYAFSRLFLFLGTQLFRDRIYLEGFLSRSLFVFFFAFAEGIVLVFLLKAFNPEPLPNLYPLFFTRFFPQILITALLSPILFSLFRKGYSLLNVSSGTSLGGHR